jgi:hypothetical protein
MMKKIVRLMMIVMVIVTFNDHYVYDDGDDDYD